MHNRFIGLFLSLSFLVPSVINAQELSNRDRYLRSLNMSLLNTKNLNIRLADSLKIRQGLMTCVNLYAGETWEKMKSRHRRDALSVVGIGQRLEAAALAEYFDIAAVYGVEVYCPELKKEIIP